MRIMHIARKEILQTLRDRRMLMTLSIAPILQLLVFGYAATYDIKHIPSAIVDYDASPGSRELIAAIQASGYFDINSSPNSSDSLSSLLDRGEIWCGLVIPAGYERDLKRGQPASLQAIFDGSNSNTAGISAGYLGRIVQDYSSRQLLLRAAANALNDSNLTSRKELPRVIPQVRAWYNPDLSSRNYNVPAVLVMIMLVITMMLTSMAIVKEKEQGTIEQISVTPIRPLELMVGKTMPFVIIGTLDILIVITVAIFWFKIPFMGSIWFLLLAAFSFMLTTLGTGLLISTLSSTQQQAMMTTFLFIMPFTILSGFAFPISNMPIEIQYLTYINPVRYFVEIARSIFLKGSGFAELRNELLALLIIGLSVLTISVLRFRKRAS